MRLSATLLPLFLLALPASAQTACPTHFLQGTPPALVQANLRPRTTELCYTSYAALASGLTRTPLWSAEHLTRDSVSRAREMVREDSFHPDPNLPEADRAELSDYVRSGYDRGHMSPNGDMPDARSQGESFSLGNMIPQSPENNRGLWSDIEGAVRDLAVRDGEVYVVTGPMFTGTSILSLKQRVLVPTSLFKAVYDPRAGAAAAYVTPNAPGRAWQAVSIDQLRQMTGIDVFPGLPASVKATAAQLPSPEGRSRSASRTEETPRHRREPEGLGTRALKYIWKNL